MNKLTQLIVIFAANFLLPAALFAETVGLFIDKAIPQSVFAAGDVKKSLVAQGFTVEELSLAELSAEYKNKKIVLAHADNAAIKNALVAQGAAAPDVLGEQAYALRTTNQSSMSYWAIGGDQNGVMYGGLQLAENIQFYGFTRTYNEQVAPHILRRGAKLNLGFDHRTPTYSGYGNHTSEILAMKYVWDMKFWTEWIDEQTRNRHNVLSVWVHNPFPALVSVPGYEDATLPYIETRDPAFPEDKNLTLNNRITFWKNVINYAHQRGFVFYFFNWNVCPDYVSTKYKQITNSQTDEDTIDYYRRAIKALLQTYPELDGFGVSPGDHMGKDKKQNAAWILKAYGTGVMEFAKENPERKFAFLHRLLKVKYNDVTNGWAEIKKLPNVQFDTSMKYCMAYTYSTTTPEWSKFDVSDLIADGGSTWLTLRNDGFFYSDFGDPQFVREFIGNLPASTYADGPHKGKPLLRGVYLGHDAYAPTRSYFYKNKELNNYDGTDQPMLEIQRKWYMEKLWGRLAYDKNTPDEVFIKHIAMRYPTLPAEQLFTAWAKVSRLQPKLMELIQGSWKLDSHFYTEASIWRNDGANHFRTIAEMGTTAVAKGSESKLANIAETAAGKINGRKSANDVADELEANAMEALRLVASMTSGGNARVEALLKNLQQQASLGAYYAYKIRGAVLLKADKKEDARAVMGKAYGWWMNYSTSMDEMYITDRFRTYDLSKIGWHFCDAANLKEFHDLGGVGTPELPALTPSPEAQKKP
jgi:hypothetical protein